MDKKSLSSESDLRSRRSRTRLSSFSSFNTPRRSLRISMPSKENTMNACAVGDSFRQFTQSNAELENAGGEAEENDAFGAVECESKPDVDSGTEVGGAARERPRKMFRTLLPSSEGTSAISGSTGGHDMKERELSIKDGEAEADHDKQREMDSTVRITAKEVEGLAAREGMSFRKHRRAENSRMNTIRSAGRSPAEAEVMARSMEARDLNEDSVFVDSREDSPVLNLRSGKRLLRGCSGVSAVTGRNASVRGSKKKTASVAISGSRTDIVNEGDNHKQCLADEQQQMSVTLKANDQTTDLTRLMVADVKLKEKENANKSYESSSVVSDPDPETPGTGSSSSVSRDRRQRKGKDKLIECNQASDETLCQSTFKEEKERFLAIDRHNSNVDGAESRSEYRTFAEMHPRERETVDALYKMRSAHEIKQRYRETARLFASKYAHFNPDEEAASNSLSHEKEALENEDWPGPFSTAMKIIRDREEKMNVRKGNSLEVSGKLGPAIEWTPKNSFSSVPSKFVIPSLVDKCISTICMYRKYIQSLDMVPDDLRSRISQMLCDSRRMDARMLRLLAGGFPTEIVVNDCSTLTEEQLKEVFTSCNITTLEVLRLDLSGRCISDYLLQDMCSQNKMPALTSVSLKGACRLTDDGLKVLADSAPSVTSMNLSQCSLITSTGLRILADRLESVLKELHLDDCHGIDAVSSLPSLTRFKNLEVLSVAHIHTISDKFVRPFVSACGQNMREFCFAECLNITDSSVKLIAQGCHGLCALDLSNLQKLTDNSLQYIANGCRRIQSLKLCRNSFSDEAVAAYLEVSGSQLRELSLNSVKEIANLTAKEIASHCGNNLQRLDLSFCRRLKDDALGLIVDSCSLLQILKLFGCTQVTHKFLNGHSNSLVKIIGLQGSPILEHM